MNEEHDCSNCKCICGHLHCGHLHCDPWRWNDSNAYHSSLTDADIEARVERLCQDLQQLDRERFERFDAVKSFGNQYLDECGDVTTDIYNRSRDLIRTALAEVRGKWIPVEIKPERQDDYLVTVTTRGINGSYTTISEYFEASGEWAIEREYPNRKVIAYQQRPTPYSPEVSE